MGVGILALFYSIFCFDYNVNYPSFFALIPVIGTLLIINSNPNIRLNSYVFGNKLIIGLGLISYPLYLWHWMLLSYAKIINGSEVPTIFVISILLISVVLSWGTYKFIEIPIQKSYSFQMKIYLIASMFIVCLLALGVKVLNGLPLRLEPYLKNYYANNEIIESEPLCKSLTKLEPRYCRINKVEDNPTVALVGDSIANGLYDPLALRYELSNENLIMIGNAGCAPFNDVNTVTKTYSDNCIKKTNEMLNYLQDNENIHTIIFSYWANYYFSGNMIFSPEKTDLFLTSTNITGSGRFIFENGLNETVKKFLAKGKKVIVVSNPPEFKFDPKACVNDFRPFNSLFSIKPSCTQPKEITDSRNKEYMQSIHKIKRLTNFMYISLDDTFCDVNYCHAAINGQLIYRDSYHLNKYGSDIAVNKIWNKIK